MRRDSEQVHDAIRGRLQAAFEGVHADAGMADRLRAKLAQTGEAATPSARTAATPRRAIRVPRWAWSAMAAAAMLALIALPAVWLLKPKDVGAAELAALHEAHVGGRADMHAAGSPAEVAAYFEKHLGFRPTLADRPEGVSVRGCCVDRVAGRAAGSIVLETDLGVVSLIAVPNDLAAGAHNASGDEAPHWQGRHGGCRMVGVTIGGATWFAVSKDVCCCRLTELLAEILPTSAPSAAPAAH